MRRERYFPISDQAHLQGRWLGLQAIAYALEDSGDLLSHHGVSEPIEEVTMTTPSTLRSRIYSHIAAAWARGQGVTI
ncbi:MAG: hypothetical protein GX620_03250 [Chloroflexi bacterium]|nr:hypothetical protein [Chloroflexota bacterium]